MKSCVPWKDLELLLTGDLPLDREDGVQVHLAACARCRASLDRLSDDPGLRGLASSSWPAEDVHHDGPELSRALDRLHLVLGSEPFEPEIISPRDGILSFLDPPLQAGDLGALGPYRILRELGRGGMGIVLLAYDPELQRRVALKVLPPERSNARAAAQFAREARALAGIEHDHVVPLHAVVSPPGGPSYLVMSYIEGPTLRERIRKEGPLAPREAARILRQAAEGLAAAHRAKLVHRDVKPANILLDAATGRAKITDFGLAITAVTESGVACERTAPGTPEYMSPEQVREPGRPDARSDIYGLGVTLYEALTGDVPFHGVPHLVLQQVVADEPRPPRRLNDRIPRDLETICLKAMAKEPQRRYQTAAEFADDLRRWLDGEPIRARPVGRVGRFQSWCRRRPALAFLTAALVLVASGSLAAVTSLWLLAEERRDQAETLARQAERNAADAQRQQELAQLHAREADEQRRLAEQNLRAARRAVHQHFTLLSEVQLSQGAGTQELRKQLLEAALAYFEHFLQQQPEDAALRAEAADAHTRVAAITSQIGSKDRALAEYERARDLFEKLAQGSPNDPELQVDLARSYHNVGRLQYETGRPAEALPSYDRARDLFEKLTQAHPNDLQHQGKLAAAYDSIGIAQQETGQPEQALASHRQARVLREKVVRANPDDSQSLGELARSHLNVGVLEDEIGKLKEAVRSYRQAQDLFAKLSQANPTSADFQAGLAASCNNLGVLQHKTGQLAEALCSLQRARELREKLVQANPTVTQYQRSLADSYVNVSLVQWKTRQPGEARRSLEQACALFEKLIHANPKVPQLQVRLGQSYLNLGLLHHDDAQWAEALRCYDQARRLFEKLVHANPDSLDYRSRLGGALNSFGLIQDVMGKPEEAILAFQQAVAQQRIAFEKAPQVTQYRLFLDRHYVDLARVQRAQGRAEEAASASLERGKLWSQDPDRLYSVAASLALCVPLAGKGKADLSAAEQTQRRHLADQAMNVLRQAVDHGFQDLHRLKTDPDLESLGLREDFKELLISLRKAQGETR